MKKNFLLIDDDEDEYFILKNVLQKINKEFICLYAYDSNVALDILKSYRPECIFIDMNMPKKTGLQFLAELKEMDEIKNTPLILYTTVVNSRLIQVATDQGAFACIKKHSSEDELLEALKAVTESL